MSDVNVQLVREFFELNAFHVMTCWRHDAARSRGPDHELQLLVENSEPAPERELGFVLRVGDVPAIRRALVEVRAWHTDRFYPSVIEGNAALRQIVETDSLERARQTFRGAEFKTILVISELPVSAEPKQRSVALLRDAGISHVLEFPTVLHEILERISAQAWYAPSPTLQTLRLLKRYNFIRRHQLELPFPTEAPPAPAAPVLETAPSPDEDDTQE